MRPSDLRGLTDTGRNEVMEGQGGHCTQVLISGGGGGHCTQVLISGGGGHCTQVLISGGGGSLYTGADIRGGVTVHRC